MLLVEVRFLLLIVDHFHPLKAKAKQRTALARGESEHVFSPIWSTHSLRVKLPSPQLIFHRSEPHITTKDITSAQIKSIFQKVMAIIILLFPCLISALTFYPIFFQPNAMVTKVSPLNLPSHLSPPSAQCALGNNYSLKAQCSFLSPPQTNNHLPMTTKVSGQDWRQEMPILCSRLWSSIGTQILNPESGLCSLHGAASKFPILPSVQPGYFKVLRIIKSS